MIIDLHIHTSTGSDGALPVGEVMLEAKKSGIGLMSITDHDSLAAQAQAVLMAKELGIQYLTGIELNATLQLTKEKPVTLDFLGYHFDIHAQRLINKLATIREHREWRAREILRRVNTELEKAKVPSLTSVDMELIKQKADGAIGRPHLADYLIKKGIVRDKQEAFDKYLVKCDVPKYPLSLPEASNLIRAAGGVLVLAHPDDPNGTSLRSLTKDLDEQTQIIQENMLEYINGVECWHSRHTVAATTHYYRFAQQHRLLFTGGSDCHQKPALLGTVDVPSEVARQFNDIL